MKNIKKRINMLFALVLVINLAVTSLSSGNGNVVKAATMAGYMSLTQSATGEAMTYKKVGSTYFGFNEKVLRVKKSGGKAKTIVSTTKYLRTVLTNGTKIFYQAGNKVYSISKDGKNKKTICTWSGENNYSLSGAYAGCLYYSYRYGDTDCDQNTYRYSIKTKKSVKLFKDQIINQQSNTYMTVMSQANDISPVSLKLYNLKTKKLTSLCKEQSGAAFVGSKIYYAKYLGYSEEDYSMNFRIQYYDIDTGKTTKVKTIYGMQVVSRFTSTGCYYLDMDCNVMFYNYKTGKTTKA